MITAALALPVVLGGLWMNLLVPRQAAARSALVWGHGSLLGLLLIPQFMRFLSALGAPLSFWAPAAITGILILVAVIAGRFSRNRGEFAPAESRVILDLPVSHKILFLCLFALVGLRAATLGLEVYWRPLFPWDATMHWATKARVWFEYRDMVPFVDKAAWLKTFGEGVFHDRHPDYPPTIPLLQVWMNLAVGRWDESVMNLPWVLGFIGLGGAFYGQLRNAAVGPAFSMVFTYFLLSMPLINTHVALAGYADLFLGATFCAALMALHNWSSSRHLWQLLLMIIFTAACLRLKTEGYLWSLTLVPAMIVATAASTRRAVALLGALAIGGLVLLLVLRQLMPDSLHPFLTHFTPFSMRGLLGIVKSGWLHDNWHLFTYLFPAAIALALLLPRAVTRTYRGIATALGLAVGAFLFLFLFTVFWEGSANFTGVGRLSIQLAPGLLFFCALLCNEVHNRGIGRGRGAQGRG